MGYALHLGNKRISLASDVDIEWLQRAITEAQRGRGRSVKVPLPRGRTELICVTPEVPITISEHELTGRATF